MPGNLINPQAAAANFYNPYQQYGVGMGYGGGAGSGLNWLSLASNLGGSAVGAAGLIGSVALQNYYNRKYYEDYQSPESRMQQMRDAGINPYAAAQGIAGGAAPSVAPPQINQEAVRALGEQLGSSVNNALQASAIKAGTENTIEDTNVKKATARALGVSTDFDLATWDDRAAALKNQNQLTDYQIEQLRPYAEHADEWYKVNFDKIDKEVDYIQKQMDEIDEQIKNLKKQRQLWDSEIGVNESTKKYNDSLRELNEQKKGLIDRLGGDNVESAYAIAVVEGDDKKAKAIRTGVEKYNESVEKGHQEGNVMASEQRKIVEFYDGEIARMEEYVQEIEDKYYNGNSFSKSWYKGELENAQSELKRLRQEKAEQLRRLNSNESSSDRFGPIGVSRSK